VPSPSSLLLSSLARVPDKPATLRPKSRLEPAVGGA
jgi:hypothetical protein